MTSKVDSANLTLRMSEEVILNGKSYGSKSVQTISSVNTIVESIFTVPANTTSTILQFSSTESIGTFTSTGIKYIRLTNLDDTNFVRLHFSDGSNVNIDVKLEPSRTMIFTNTYFSGTDANNTFSSFSNFTTISGKADTSPVDIEVFAAGG